MIKHLSRIFSVSRFPSYIYYILFLSWRNVLFYRFQFRGMLSIPESATLYMLASRLSKKCTIVELGCYGGLSTAFLLKAKQKSVLLYSIDPFDTSLKKQKNDILNNKDKDYNTEEVKILIKKPSKQEVERLLKEKGFRNFELIEGYSYDVIKKWKKPIDLLWIDANHDYAAVKKDFIQWEVYLKKGGVIAFHDANKQGNSKTWNMGWTGPTKVVKEYLHAPKWKDITHVDSIVYATKV